MKSFSDLLELHRQLDELFLEHQRALLRLNLARATELLDQYARELLAHIRDEEALLMPLYQGRVTAPTGGATGPVRSASTVRNSTPPSPAVTGVGT